MLKEDVSRHLHTESFRGHSRETRTVRLSPIRRTIATRLMSAQLDGDSMTFHNYCDIGIAVGGGKGLVVPVLRNAETMSFADIERTITDLSVRAQKSQIELDELEGGTFTITNGGVYGSLLSTHPS